MTILHNVPNYWNWNWPSALAGGMRGAGQLIIFPWLVGENDLTQSEWQNK